MSWSGKFKNGESFNDLTDDELNRFESEIEESTVFENKQESPSEMRERAKKEYASDVLQQKLQEAASIKENNPVIAAILPRYVEKKQEQSLKQENSPSDYITHPWAALRDVASLTGRLVTEGIGAIGDLAGGYPDQAGALDRIGNIGKDATMPEYYNLAKGITTDPLLPAYLATGLIGGPVGAALKPEIIKGLGRAAAAFSIPMVDKLLAREEIKPIDVLSSGLGALIPAGPDFMAIRSGVKGAKQAAIDKEISRFAEGLKKSEATQAIKQQEKFDMALNDEPVEIVKYPSVDFKKNKLKELEEAKAKLTNDQPLSVDIVDATITTGATSLLGPAAGIAAPFVRREIQKMPIKVTADMLARQGKGIDWGRTITQSLADQLQSNKISRQDANAVLRALDTLRFNPSDSAATKIRDDYMKRVGM